METRQVILQLRTAKGLSQEELAAKVYVTRQAVSRWETGETVPNTETLKLLSQLFDVSINTLLGSPRTLVCQSCGMPLTDDNKGTNADGTQNEDYCIYCYKDGKFTQNMTMEQMIDHCAQFTDEINKQSGQNLTPEQAKEMMRRFFPHLKRWKN